MNPQLLLAHFNRVAEAPNALPRLRRFIFDLAVRGKLVEQDPTDEPARELLKRIQVEKARLVKAGKAKSTKTADQINEEAELFALPASWVWCRLSEIGAIVGGGTPPSGDANNFTAGGSGIAWLTPADLGKHSELFISHGARDLTSQGLRSSSATIMPKGSVLFTSRAPIGYTAIAKNDLATNQGFKSVVPYITECNLYIAIYFRALGKWIDSKASGTTFREVSAKIVSVLPFPLAPLAEQRRIVAKLDELMALCDRLEATQRERETRRNRLTAACHYFLSNDANEDDSRKHADFFFSHLPRLTKCQNQVQQLRQIIRTLAIQGRLVRQDPTDGSASQLVTEIAQNRKRLYAAKKIPKPTQLPLMSEPDMPFTTPNGWCWTMLGDLCYQVSDGPHFSPQYVGPQEGVPFLSTRNVRPGTFDLSSLKYISHKDHEAFSKRIRPEKGDILYTKGGTTGLAKVNDLDFQFSVWVHLAVLRIDKERLFPRYVELALNSPHCYEQSQRYTQGISNFDLGLTRMVKITVPLPPLAEQRRIVAKVDELMALCDRLEAQLSTVQHESGCLLESVLHHALITPEALNNIAELAPQSEAHA